MRSELSIGGPKIYRRQTAQRKRLIAGLVVFRSQRQATQLRIEPLPCAIPPYRPGLDFTAFEHVARHVAVALSRMSRPFFMQGGLRNNQVACACYGVPYFARVWLHPPHLAKDVVGGAGGVEVNEPTPRPQSIRFQHTAWDLQEAIHERKGSVAG